LAAGRSSLATAGATTIYKFRLAGYSIDYFVDFSVTTDLKNSTSRIIDVNNFAPIAIISPRQKY
jgi:hypothetical protein